MEEKSDEIRVDRQATSLQDEPKITERSAHIMGALSLTPLGRWPWCVVHLRFFVVGGPASNCKALQ